MAICNILVPKLEVDFFSFEPNIDATKVTVRSLRAMCKAGGLKQTGLKADLMARAMENNLLEEGKHEPGPRWFYFDEAFGVGDQTLHYMCMCGASMSLDMKLYSTGNTRQFKIRPDGIVYPSLICGNKKCSYHIFARLEGYDGGSSRGNKDDWAYTYSHRKYDHDHDKYNSKLFNKNSR